MGALDAYRSAKLLIDQHGNEAPIHAAMRADELLDRGDMKGRASWLRIMGGVEELLSTRPRNGGSAGSAFMLFLSPSR